MTNSVHKDLTGADLHEPKGADTALAGQVYVSDGAGSGAWTAASSVITNTAWSTGDLKATHKVTADTSWIMWVEGSIGDGSSAATIRANADCSDLFALYWNNYSDTLCPVSTGRGISAAADFAAHKKLTLPKGPGRAIGIAGAGTGLTTRVLGTPLGSETVMLSQSNLPNVAPSFTGATTSVTVLSDTAGVLVGSVRDPNQGTQAGGSFFMTSLTANSVAPRQLTSTGTCVPLGFNGSINGGVTQTATSILPATTYVNVMIKL